MSQNWRKMAKMLHNAAKKFDWEVTVVDNAVRPIQVYLQRRCGYLKFIIELYCTKDKFNKIIKTVKTYITIILLWHYHICKTQSEFRESNLGLYVKSVTPLTHKYLFLYLTTFVSRYFYTGNFCKSVGTCRYFCKIIGTNIAYRSFIHFFSANN